MSTTEWKIRKLNDTLRTISDERARTRALENLASLLRRDSREAPVVTVAPSEGRFRLWCGKKDRDAGEEPMRDITLTDDERFELMEWLRTYAWKRKAHADELEAKLANGITDD